MVADLKEAALPMYTVHIAPMPHFCAPSFQHRILDPPLF